MKIAFILGTRPEIIKLAPIIRECDKKRINYFVLHSGQHYDYEMDKIFFKELKLRPESINLNVGSGRHGEITGKMLIGIERILINKKPDIILVQGDTNTVLAGALAAVKLHINVGHVEAGLRSYDKMQPEEYNRTAVDHIGNYLFVPTKKSKENLLKEGIKKEYIYLTGNTIVDSVFQALALARKKSQILDKLNLQKNGYFLLTVHREENVDKKEKLLEILKGLKNISQKYEFPLIFPIHPRTRKKIKEFGLIDVVKKIKNMKLINPVGFFDFLMLETNARLVLSDSGGVVEECCILRVPCVSMRDYSDRPESIEVGASILSGCKADKILKATELMLKRKRSWENPFGDGKAAKKIIRIILEK